MFGEFSIVNIIFTPVALRLVAYSIPVSDRAQEFIDDVQGSATVRQWVEAAHAVADAISFIDELVPAASGPLTLG